MELKDTGFITIDKGNTQKVKGALLHYDEIDRTLLVHEDVDNKNNSSVTDSVTGYRLFSIPQKISILKKEQVDEYLNNFIKHYTLEEIAKEFKRIEELPKEERKKK